MCANDSPILIQFSGRPTTIESFDEYFMSYKNEGD